MRLNGAMNNNKLIIAAAGSGKTTYLVKMALDITKENVLITTYTEANLAEIKNKIISKKGCIPSNITVQTWFTFLLQHGVRPFQSILNADIHEKNIGFFLINQKSGHRYGNVYWGKKDFHKFYFTKSMKIYSDKISKFVFECNKKSNDLIVNRIIQIFDHIFIDEIQDLAGYDLELIKLLFKSSKPTLLVGDPRQVTYLTHPTTKYKKYSNGKIKEFVSNELGKNIHCSVDETTLNLSHRNNQSICLFSAKIYPNLPAPSACTCPVCRDNETDHEGVFAILDSDIQDYLMKYKATQLRWSSKTKCNESFPSINFGESKGLTFDRVLIYPTKDMVKWIENNKHNLKNETRAKFYVAITRARHSAAIVMNSNTIKECNDIEEFCIGDENYE